MAVFQRLAEIRIWSPNFHSSLHFFTIYLQLIIKRDIYPLFINYLSFLSLYVVIFRVFCHSSLIMKNIKIHSYISKNVVHLSVGFEGQ